MRFQKLMLGTVLLGACTVPFVVGNELPQVKEKPTARGHENGEKNGHQAMLKDHEQAHADHDAALIQLGKWRIDHRRVLSALSSIESKILEHDADLEELAEHARLHEDHIWHHDEEIREHEGGGAGKEHARLAASHEQIQEEHKKFQAKLNDIKDDHTHLTTEILKLAASLNLKSEAK